MKKFLTLVAALCCAVAAMATDYDGLLTVVVNNDTTRQEAKISLTQSANGYKFSLNNFMLKAGDQVLGVGNIALDSLTAAPQYGYKTIAVKKSVNIAAGTDPSVETWVGPMLGPVPLNLTANFIDDALDFSISIYMAALEQNVNVHFFGTAPVAASGDLNGDGVTNVTDVTTLVQMILNAK